MQQTAAPTCQGFDPGPLKEPGRAVVIVQLIIRGLPASVDAAVLLLNVQVIKVIV